MSFVNVLSLTVDDASYRFFHRYHSLHMVKDCKGPGHIQCKGHPHNQGGRSRLLCCLWTCTVHLCHRGRGHRGQWGWAASPPVSGCQWRLGLHLVYC